MSFAGAITKAIDALRLYAVKEEIPLIISEVPPELVQETAAMFSNAVCDAEDEQGERFTVRVLSEIMTVEELPTLRGKRILLTALTSEDERVYARLCRDNDTNKYWGYDFAEDNSSPEDSYFLECVGDELTRGTAASFALKLEGEFVGEAVLYAFDLLGGAECAVRLLPEFRGKGLAVECVELICEAARFFKLSRLYATVDNRNEPSINLFSKSFLSFEEKDGKTRFLLEM